MLGTVTRVIEERGFGFIEDEERREYFFHRSALNGTEFGELAPGVAVEFEVSNENTGDEEHEGPRAVNVHIAPGAVGAVDGEILPPAKVNP